MKVIISIFVVALVICSTGILMFVNGDNPNIARGVIVFGIMLNVIWIVMFIRRLLKSNKPFDFRQRN